MASNRKLPFGYEIRMGQVCVQEQEAKIVRAIFKAYAEGASYRQLTDWLNTQPIAYHETDKPWNKNMIARILSCSVYAGGQDYPSLITEEEQMRAFTAKPTIGKAEGDGHLDKALRALARCDVCGDRLEYRQNYAGWARWICPSCGMLSPQISMESVKKDIRSILEYLFIHADSVQPPQCLHYQATQQEDEFIRMINTAGFDEVTAKEMVMDIIAGRFEALGSEDYETERIRNILTSLESTSKAGTSLLEQISTAVLIHPNGSISLKLRNKQIIERSQVS